MKILIALWLLPMAAACTPVQFRDAAPAGPCTVSDLLRGRYVGTKFNLAMRDTIQHEANARTARVLNPGDVTTREFRKDRLNIVLDDDKRIDGLRCG